MTAKQYDEERGVSWHAVIFDSRGGPVYESMPGPDEPTTESVERAARDRGCDSFEIVRTESVIRRYQVE